MRHFVVVSRTNPKLFEMLSSAFRHRSGFTVIEDRRTLAAERRSAPRTDAPPPRRSDEDGWNGHDFLVAERHDPLL
jgi:hypothetical protein